MSANLSSSSASLMANHFAVLPEPVDWEYEHDRIKCRNNGQKKYFASFRPVFLSTFALKLGSQKPVYLSVIIRVCYIRANASTTKLSGVHGNKLFLLINTKILIPFINTSSVPKKSRVPEDRCLQKTGWILGFWV
jgi:hypothetical protein